MKKLLSLVALLCLVTCLACPVFADGVGRDDVLAGTFSTAETADTGGQMSDATTGSANTLTNLINGVKEKWDEFFGGLAGVLEFLTVCVGGSIGALPASYIVYVVMLCVCISVIAIIKALGDKKK